MTRAPALLALVCVAACVSEGSRAPLRAGDPAPEFGARSLGGDSVNLSALRGRPVIVNVWATWCGPCRAEMPELQELAERFDGRLEVVGVSIDQRGAEAEVRRFLEEVGVDFRIWLDPSQRVVRRFTTLGVPESFLIDADGVVRRRWTGRFAPLALENVALVEELVDQAETVS